MLSNLKLSTVNRTSIIISLYTCVLMIFLGIVFNVGYFFTRHPQQKAILQNITPDETFATSLPSNESMREHLTRRDVLSQQVNNQDIKSHNQSHFYFISDSSPDYNRIHGDEKERNTESGIISHNGYDFMSRSINGGIILIDISGYKEKEDMLMALTCIILILMISTIFFITRILITRSLKNLTQLEEYTNNLNGDTKSPPLTFEHLPNNDPIQKLSQAIFHFHRGQFKYTENIKQFMSSVAHEIKTPLQVIQTKIELELGEHTGSKNMIAIEKQVNHIADLIDVLSTLTFAQYQKIPLQSLDIEKIIHDVVHDFEIQYPTYQREYTSKEANYIKQGNKVSISTIITNILQNAIKYSKTGSIISISVDQDFCSISDEGTGMSDEEVTHVRDPFWQADSSKGKDGGFGLGLTLVKKLIDLHGWSIECASMKDKGTSFIIHR